MPPIIKIVTIMIINYVLKFMIFKIFEDFLIIYLLLFFLKNRISLYYY